MNTIRRFAVSTAAALTLGLFGCSAGMPVKTVPVTPSAHPLRGAAHGGQQPIQGGHLYLYAVGTGGYGSGSTSLLNGGSNVVTDANGNGYIVTDAGGGFDLTGDYSCPSSTSLVYVLLAGGNAGTGANSSLYLMAALGNCMTLQTNAANIFISLNEISTVAAVYALAPFIGSPTAIGAPGSNLAGITNAFAEVPNIVSLGLGMPYSTTPAGNGVVPAKLLNTVADFIAICVNSNGLTTNGLTTNCDQVFVPTTVNGSTPQDTITAVLRIVQNPANNANTIVNDVLPTAPFQPTLGSATNLAMAVVYSGGGISTPTSIAVDAAGNAWVASAGNAVTELGAGARSFLSGSGGYTNGNLDAPTSIAIDTSGNVWVANCGGQCSGTAHASSLTMYTPGSGNTVTAQSFSGGSLSGAYSVAIDGSNHAWVANAFGASVSMFTSAGNQSGANGYVSTFQANPAAVAADMAGNTYAVSPSTNALVQFDSSGNIGGNSYQGPGLIYPTAVAVDSGNRPWVVNPTMNSLTMVNGSPTTPFTGGGLNQPNAIAFDGSNRAWVTNSNGTVSTFNNAGAALSPASGYVTGAAFANGIAVDGSGTVWVTSCGSYCTGSGSDSGGVYQIIGIATPVVTPLAAGAKNGQLAIAP